MPQTAARAGLLLLVTAPWAVRHRFPVNRFSRNYDKDVQSPLHIKLMYRIKKYQYVLYKHGLLHGLNICLAVAPSSLVLAPHFQQYWVCLNTAYVLEFFLQTLVRRGVLTQRMMIAANVSLMMASSVAAAKVLWDATLPGLGPLPAVLSTAANFLHRGHDVANTMAVAAVVSAGVWCMAGLPTTH